MKLVSKHISTSLSLHKKLPYIFLSAIFLLVSIPNFAFAAGLGTTSNGYVGQSPYSSLCWAATSTSMVQTKNIYTTMEDHTIAALGTFSNVGRSRANIVNDFQKIYYISASLTGTLGYVSVQSYVNANKPIYAGINWSDGSAHGVAISGYDTSDNTVRVMDPLYGWQYPTYSSFSGNYLGSGSWVQSIYFN